jgi:hypothetical protein
VNKKEPASARVSHIPPKVNCIVFKLVCQVIASAPRSIGEAIPLSDTLAPRSKREVPDGSQCGLFVFVLFDNHEAMGGYIYISSKEHERGTHHSGGTLAPRSKREVQPKLLHGLIVL